MKSTLPAAHLVRLYLLFALTVTFLLTTIRAALALWQFPELEQSGAYVALFVQGLRFDLALIGIIGMVPVLVGSLLSSLGWLRGLAKIIIVMFLSGGLLLILILEIMTPWFIHTQGMRPDLALFRTVESPVNTLLSVIGEYPVQVLVATGVSVLILIAFWARMELSRFLRYRTSVPGALGVAFFGTLLCLVAIWSTPDLRQAAFGPGDALISTNTTVNEIAMNTTYKTLYSVVLPVFNQ